MKKDYIIGLNGIRAIAVFLVIIAHRFPKDHIFMSFPLGTYGVNIFFVLSGFLISRGLFFQLSNEVDTFNSNIRILKNFIIKRFLRIFPIYYLLLFFMYLAYGVVGNNFRENILWYIFYGVNYLIYRESNWLGCLGHLWSLSVEEQFYIFFPVLVIFLFRKRILFMLITFVIIGTVYPFFVEGWSTILTLSCINAFGIGGLLAYVEFYKSSFLATFYRYSFFLSAAMLLLLICHNLYFAIPFFSERLAISIIAIYLITLCLLKQGSFVVNKVFNNSILNFIGIISYGVYLYHNIVAKYWNLIVSKLNIKTNFNQFSYVEFLLQTSLIIIVSYFSWIIIEKPILNLKKYLLS